MKETSAGSLDLIWVYDGSLSRVMDAATWLQTVSELRNLGCQVTLMSAGPQGYHHIRGVEVLCMARPKIYFLGHALFHIRALHAMLRQFRKTDAILFHEISAPWILPLRLWRRLRGRQRPVLVMDTRSLPMSHPNKKAWREQARISVYSFLIELGNRFADGRLAITQRMAEVVHIPAGKLWGIWPSGADPEPFSIARKNRRWPSRDEPIRLVYHGALHHERNLMALCRAVVRANEDGMVFELSLVGNGTQQTELSEFTMAKSAGKIHVMPPVPFDEVPEILARSHVGALPFPDEEKFRVSSPIKLFEYMAAGLPVLLTRIPCHTDVAGSGEYAFWAEDSDVESILDALRSVWQSRDSLSGMGQQAAIASKNWTWRTSAEKLKKAVESGIHRLAIYPIPANGDAAEQPSARQIGDKF